MAHIPKCGTAELQIPDFRAALSQSLLPQEDYDSEKWLYVPCRYDEFRYILGTKGKKPLICIGINPSTARPDALDNTLKSVERTALFNGYDSFLRTIWSEPSILFCTGRTWRRLPTFWKMREDSLLSGPHGEQSLKKGSICLIAWRRWCLWGNSTVRSGTPVASGPQKDTLITPCT